MSYVMVKSCVDPLAGKTFYVESNDTDIVNTDTIQTVTTVTGSLVIQSFCIEASDNVGWLSNYTELDDVAVAGTLEQPNDHKQWNYPMTKCSKIVAKIHTAGSSRVYYSWILSYWK